MEKQTAVEYIIDSLNKHFSHLGATEIVYTIGEKHLQTMERWAKKLEKQMMLNFWNGGIQSKENGISFDQYYEEYMKRKEG
jgi:hypothetical protein